MIRNDLFLRAAMVAPRLLTALRGGSFGPRIHANPREWEGWQKHYPGWFYSPGLASFAGEL